MCGILGLIGGNKENFGTMLDKIYHRGPDSYGVWSDDHIVLGHRRLSILDLSPAGHQPMLSPTTRYTITFNGEIYNFQSLRKELELLHYNFKGHSDTEIMLAAFEAWGIEASLKKFNGMFAFGLWDRQEKKLYLARDRFGEKPLYYGWIGEEFIFGSELKSFKAHPNAKFEIDEEALSLYLQHSYIPAPFSIYKNIKKLEPGRFLILDGKNITISTYWSAIDVAKHSYDQKLDLSDETAVELLDEKLTRIVGARQVADVPLGAFLSGGVDSSTIVALMQKNSRVPVKTFTIGFDEDKYNEANYAKEVAHHLKTEHTEVYLNQDDALNIIPNLSDIYDEPFADSSQIPTYLVSKIAREKVTVCLSGDAGDELFGGYNRYLFAEKIAKKIDKSPFWLRKAVATCLLKISPQQWDSIYNNFILKIKPTLKISSLGDKIHKVGGLLAYVHNKYELYHYLINQLHIKDNILLNHHQEAQDFAKIPTSLDYMAWMMLADTISYLPGDILTKVDRASMAVSLESRIPFLDPELYEFAWQLPGSMKVRHGQGKWLLRQVLYKYVPKDLIERPKMGFGVPIDLWLRKELKTWAYDLLNGNDIKEQGYFDYQVVKKMLDEHMSGTRNFSAGLWNILMFQSWLKKQ